jgi:hypothetical protein
MKIFLGISIVILLVIVYFAFLKNQKINTSTGVKKYDIQMFFAAILWNIFFFGLLYYIIGPEKMQEFWFVLVFMFILSLFQYIWKWDYAWALHLGCFFFLIIYLRWNDLSNLEKGGESSNRNLAGEVDFRILNKNTGQSYYGKTPVLDLSVNYEYDITPEITKQIRVEIIGKNFYFIDTLTGGDTWDVNFPRHPRNAKFFITAVK